MQQFKKPTSASYCTPETTLRFILNLLIVVALLAATPSLLILARKAHHRLATTAQNPRCRPFK